MAKQDEMVSLPCGVCGTEREVGYYYAVKCLAGKKPNVCPKCKANETSKLSTGSFRHKIGSRWYMCTHVTCPSCGAVRPMPIAKMRERQKAGIFTGLCKYCSMLANGYVGKEQRDIRKDGCRVVVERMAKHEYGGPHPVKAGDRERCQEYLQCRDYDRCLDIVAGKQWPGWMCSTDKEPNRISLLERVIWREYIDHVVDNAPDSWGEDSYLALVSARKPRRRR